MISLSIDVIDNLINHEIKDRFDFNRDDCRNLKRYFKRTKAENKDAQLSDIFNKYTPPFAEVADKVMERRAFFTFDDTKEIYVYRNGVYVSKGAETEIKQLSRDICCQMYEQHDLLPVVPSMTYVSEILELIRVRTAVYRDEIDNNPKNKYIINMKNGLYNIKTGELTDHTEEYISLRQIPVNYNPAANAPKFRKFMSEVVTPEDAQILLEFIGYSLIFDMKHDQAIMLQGTGANGKSILLQFIIALHGEENICSTSLQRLCKDRFALSELYGKPLNVFADLSDDGIKDDAMFKNVSSGDMITAEKKFGQPFQFRNSARQMYSVNDVPPVHKKTFAFFRRWILLCFPYTFVDNPAPDTNERKIDKGLLDALLTPEELSGAFNLAIECMKYMLSKGKYSYASTVADVTELYTLKSDPVKAFTDRYTDASDDHIPVQEMYENYVRWSKYKGLKILTSQRLTRRLKQLGFVESRPHDDYGSRIYAWVNVSFTDDFDKEIPAEVKPEQKKLDNKYTHTDKKILYWQELGKKLDEQLEEAKNSKNAQLSTDIQTVGPTSVQLKNDGFSIAAHSRATPSVHKKSLSKESWEKNAHTHGNNGCVRAINFKVFLDREKLRTNYPRSLRRITKNPRIKLDQTWTKNGENSNGNEENNNMKNSDNLTQLRRDLEFFKSAYIRTYGGIESIEVFVGAFEKGIPGKKTNFSGYFKLFPRQAIIYEAERICKTIPQPFMSRVVLVKEATMFLKERGY